MGRTSLTKQVTRTIAGAADAALGASFVLLAKGSGPMLIRFGRRSSPDAHPETLGASRLGPSSGFEAEIAFHLDKGWHREEGGTLFGDVTCLVHRVQRAVHGVPQTLFEPDYAKPIAVFQYGLGAPSPVRAWEVTPPSVSTLGEILEGWLRDVAVPWLEPFETESGLHSYLEACGHHSTLALLAAADGDPERARRSVARWLSGLPRRIDADLERLETAGVLTPEERKVIRLASLQSEDDYRAAVGPLLR